MAVLQIQIPMRSTEYRRRVESDFLEIKTDKGKIYFHSLRHGFTTFLVENGADIKTAQLRGQNQTCWNNVKCNETPISKHSTQQAAVGFEPTNNGFANRRLNNTSPFIKGTCGNSKNSCTEKNTESSQIPSDVHRLAAVWDDLPNNIRRAIMALIGSTED